METILQFLQDYDKLISILSFVFMAVFAVLLYRKTGNIKYLEEVFQDMKYRKENYQDKEPVKGQTYSKYVDVYRLNKATGLLEKEDTPIDIDELIKSSMNNILDVILDKFLPNNTPIVDEVAQRDVLRDDLDILQEGFEIAQEMRERYKLSDDMSVQDIFAYVNKKYDEVSKDIQAKQSIIDSVSNKEVKNNEEKTIEESK